MNNLQPKSAIHVQCFGRQENEEFLQNLKDRGYVLSNGQPIDPKDIRFIARYIEDDGRPNPLNCYTVDDSM